MTKELSKTLVATKKQEALADNEMERKKDILSVIGSHSFSFRELRLTY